MPKLENELNNFFASDEITNQRLDPFAKGALTVIIARNTDGKYDDIIATLQAAYDPFHKNNSSLSSDVVIGRGKTELRVNVIEEFKDFARNSRGAVRTKYFKLHHDLYVEIYPNELTDINKMNKVTSGIIIDRYADRVHAHVADFTPAFDTEAASFKTRYAAAVDVQTTAKGSVSEDRTGRDDGRDLLNKELYAAFNFVKSKCYANYEYMHGIFPLETLYKHTPHDIKHLNGLVDALATVNAAEAIYDGTYWMLLHNIGPTDLRVGLELTATTAVGIANGKVVKKGMSKSFKIITTGDPNNHFINITNLNLTEGGSWKMDIYQED